MKSRANSVVAFLFISFFILISERSKGQIIPDVNGIVYVTTNGIGNGSSWGAATSNLQAAIDANNVHQVFVATGVYDAPVGSFKLKNDVAIYGGFDPLNGITTLSQERVKPNPSNLLGSVLDGKNVRTVIYNEKNFYAERLTNSAILDGFTITGGNASTMGGGIYNRNSSPTLTNLVIKNNTSSNGGGGIFNFQSSNIKLSNVIIANNSANNGNGGGIANAASSSPVISNVEIRNNNSSKSGGGMSNGQDCYPVLTNVLLSGNTAGNGEYGGAIAYWGFGKTTLTNVTIVNNTPNALFSAHESSYDIFNSIVFGGIRGQILTDGHYNPNHSLVEGNVYFNNWNVDATSLTPADVFTNPSSENYTLKQGSPAVNAGSNGLYPGLNANTKDLSGNPRVYQYDLGGAIDIGAYESTYSPAVVAGAFGVAYVRTSYYGNGNGSSWENATVNLQDAINATGVTHVFVEKGTYAVPSPHSFIMKNGVKIYGGFDPLNNIKTLSDTRIMPGKGNQGSILDGKNERPVIWNDFEGSAAMTGTSVLDGFTITRASGTNQGSIYNRNASPTLKNLLIHRNNTSGIYNAKGSPTLSNVAIVKNSGIGIQQMEGSIVLNNTTIAENGAAMFVNPANAMIAINNSIVFGGIYGFTGSNISAQYSFVESPQIQNSTNVSSAGFTVGDIFTDPDGLDFSPKLNTPVINKANQNLFPDYSAISKDLAGNPRLSGIKMDIGAYENIDGPMPVVFSSFSAYIKNGKLFVNWATESESNNDHFLIQVSEDGKSWRTVETVISKAVDGNSSESIAYSSSIPTSAAMVVTGFLLILVAPFSARRYRSLLAIAILSVIIVGCSKNELVKSIGINKLFVRVVQVDKDGTEKVSKVIQAAN
ncbi:MAG: hypothetical protein E6Q89_01500 [Bacteroidia bacterium]|nr:MAG: hypothetical protein E6Q89_01500 [Bacteroidia bacterium]